MLVTFSSQVSLKLSLFDNIQALDQLLLGSFNCQAKYCLGFLSFLMLFRHQASYYSVFLNAKDQLLLDFLSSSLFDNIWALDQLLLDPLNHQRPAIIRLSLWITAQIALFGLFALDHYLDISTWVAFDYCLNCSTWITLDYYLDYFTQITLNHYLDCSTWITLDHYLDCSTTTPILGQAGLLTLSKNFLCSWPSGPSDFQLGFSLLLANQILQLSAKIHSHS